MKTFVPIVLISALVLSACADRREQGPRETDPDFHPTINLLNKYDTNHDGTITRAEMEEGLKKEFDAADTNHDGKLDPDEVAAVNAQRWNDGQSTASTIVDWNQDGFVDFHEFAGTARSLFADIDRDGDGQLSPEELKSYRGHKKPLDDDRDPNLPDEHHGRHQGGDN